MDSEQRRLDFQARLEQVSGLSESNVHFQPPTGTEMGWPCVTYSTSKPRTQFADNIRYRSADGYTVTVITKDPTDPIRSQVAAMPYTSFERWYATDGLNHFVYNVFF